MAMQAFGGSTAIAQQFLVDQKKWLTQSEFLILSRFLKSFRDPIS